MEKGYDRMVKRVKEKNSELGKSGSAEGYVASLDDIKTLISYWRKEGAFLDNEHDHREDRAVGRTYKECARQLEALVL